MKIYTLNILIVACFTSFTLFGVQEPKIERVALFKNGISHFSASQTIPDKNKVLELGEFKTPILGTFWVNYPKKVKVKKLYTSYKSVARTNNIQNLAGLITANVNKSAIFKFAYDPNQSVTGTIVSVCQQTTLITTERKTIAINLNQIIQAEFESNSLQTKTFSSNNVNIVKLELEKSAKGQDLELNWLANGMTWSPSYVVDLTDPHKAQITAKAIVINEVADLKNVTLELVSGYPHIKYSDKTSPFSLNYSLTQYIRNLNQSNSSYYRNNFESQMLMQNTVSRNTRVNSQLLTISPEMLENTSGDLYFYPIKNFSLKKNEKAYVPVFDVSVPYEHIYTWEIGDAFDQNGYFNRDGKKYDWFGNLIKSENNIVSHSCRLKNPTEMPWTTAPIEFTKDRRFIGQDMISYTAPGTESTVHINRALNVIAKEVEYEISRNGSHTNLFGKRYYPVTIKGQLSIRNRLAKKINCEVTKLISGKLKTSAPKADDLVFSRTAYRVNESHKLTWEIELESDQEKTIAYSYNVYVRH